MSQSNVLIYFRTGLAASGLAGRPSVGTADLKDSSLPWSSTAISLKNSREARHEFTKWLNFADPLRTLAVRQLSSRLVKKYEHMITVQPSLLTFRGDPHVYFGLLMEASKEIADKNGFSNAEEMRSFRASIQSSLDKVRIALDTVAEQEGEKPGSMTTTQALQSASMEKDYSQDEIRIAGLLRRHIGRDDTSVATAVWVPETEEEVEAALNGERPEEPIPLQLCPQKSEALDQETSDSRIEKRIILHNVEKTGDKEIKFRSSPDDRKRIAAKCASGMSTILDFLGHVGATPIVSVREVHSVRSGEKRTDIFIRGLVDLYEADLKSLRSIKQLWGSSDFGNPRKGIDSVLQIFSILQ